MLAACGSASSTTTSASPTAAATSTPALTPAATPTPTAAAAVQIPTPITNATSVRDQLLAMATPGMQLNSAGGLDVWTATGLQFQGSGTAATPSAVSGFLFVTSKSKGVDYVAIAVADSSGGCAGGVVELNQGSPPTVARTIPESVPAGSTCSGDAVAQAAGY